MDTWHHLKGHLEPSPFNNLKFDIKNKHFTCLCETNWAKRATTFWTILHGCAKFLHGCAKFLHVHAKSTYTSSSTSNTNSTSNLICTVMRIYSIWFLSSSLSILQFSFFDSKLATSNKLQIPVQTNCIASSIMHLDHHQHYLFS